MSEHAHALLAGSTWRSSERPTRMRRMHPPGRTRMRQLPNVQSSSFFSKTLGRVLKFRATTHAIRCIDKAGDIDHWLLKSPNSLILNPQAIALKKKIRRIKAKTSPADVAISSASA